MNNFQISGSSCETHYGLSNKTKTELLFRPDATQRMIKRREFRYTWSKDMWPRGKLTSQMGIAPFLPSHSATPVLTLSIGFSADCSHCSYFQQLYHQRIQKYLQTSETHVLTDFMFIWLLLYKLTDNTVELKGSLQCSGCSPRGAYSCPHSQENSTK
jgi:hypothetical protein